MQLLDGSGQDSKHTILEVAMAICRQQCCLLQEAQPTAEIPIILLIT